MTFAFLSFILMEEAADITADTAEEMFFCIFGKFILRYLINAGQKLLITRPLSTSSPACMSREFLKSSAYEKAFSKPAFFKAEKNCPQLHSGY